MSAERARARKKKTMALLLFVIMFGGIFTAIPFIGSQGGGGTQPSPSPTPPLLFQRNLSTFEEALRLAPASALRVSFTSDRGLASTDLGGYVAQRHARWAQVYGAGVSAEAFVVLPGEVPLWLHSLSGPAPRAPAAITYRNASIVEFFPGRQPWLGIVTNSDPLITGVRTPNRVGPPYLIGLEETLDLFEGRANTTAHDRFRDLAVSLDPGARFAAVSAAPVRGWDNRSAFSVVPGEGERYLLNAVLESRAPNTTDLQALQANATGRGLSLAWSPEGAGVRLRVEGNWTPLLGGIRDWGLLPPGE